MYFKATVKLIKKYISNVIAKVDQYKKYKISNTFDEDIDEDRIRYAMYP